MSGSYFSYNGVELAYLQTQSIQSDTERDPTDTDQLWRKDVVRVRGVVANIEGFYSQYGSNPAQIYNSLIHLLTTDRAPLIYRYDGQDIVVCNSPPDANKGPKAGPAVVTQLLEGGWLVDFTVTTWNAACGNGGENGAQYASHRYTQTETYDHNWSTVFRVRGKVIVRNDLRVNPDALRSVVIPPILDNFERSELSFTLSPDGLQLDYSFEDRQKHKMPPAPATKADGTFVVMSDPKGVILTGMCSLHLEGPPDVNRKDLIAVACKIAMAKFKGANLLVNQKTKRPPIFSASFGEKLFDNVVDVTFQGRLETPTVTVDKVPIILGFGDTPNVGTVGIAPDVRQRLDPLIVGAFLTPCGALASNTLTTGSGSSEYYLSTGPTSESQGSFDEMTAETDAFSDEDPGGYDSYTVTVDYHRDEGRAMLPSTSTGLAKIVRLHKPTMKMEVTWEAKRSGRPPIIPAYFSDDPNLVEFGGTLSPEQMSYGADLSVPVYRIAGRYVYAVIDPSKVSVLSPIPPFLSDTASLAAKETAGYLENRVLFRFKGADGPNPFDKERASSALGKKPTDVLTEQIGGAGGAASTLETGVPSDPAQKGSGGRLMPGPPVNP